MPMLEINYIRGIYILMLLLEVGYSYWPFVGYTTRPHGLLMAGKVNGVRNRVFLSFIGVTLSYLSVALRCTTDRTLATI